MPLRFRRLPFTYLRKMGLGLLLLGGIVAAANFPPDVIVPRMFAITAGLARAWFYFCSMMLGAAPFLAAGALAAAAATRSRIALPLFAALFPGCDCSMNAYVSSLQTERPALSAFALVWGSCCNPLALFSTAAILGPRMLVLRMISGAIAASLTAAAWSKIPKRRHQHMCDRRPEFWHSFTDFGGNGVASFAIAAAASAGFLTLRPHSMHTMTLFAAALAGAALSPCSSSDALLARVLFAQPATQLVFIVAAQCLDVRQMVMTSRSFGALHAACAFCAALVACCIGRALA